MKTSRSYSIFVIVVFFLFMLLHQTDKLMIGSMQTPISATFGLNDLQWGLVNSGSLVVASLLYPVWGYLCDRFSRARLLALASFIWGSTTWLSAIVKTFPQFLVTRASTGIDDSSYPGMYSLVADYFQPEMRSRIYGILQFAQPIGYLVGMILALILLVNAAMSLFYHLTSGAIQQFIPRPYGFFDQAILQAKFYLRNIFKGGPHPMEKTKEQKLNSLQSNYAALLANTQRGALNQLSVIEAAQPPNLPIGPDRLIIILLAAAVGFVMAAAAAYLLEYLDDTFKSPDMVQKTLGLTTLGAVPVMDEVTPGNELAPLINDHSATTEAYRVLRTNLQFASVDRPLHTLMVTSPAPSEGKSMTSANLAAAVARAGRQVILVDADLHRPRLHRVFNLTNNVGVTSALLADHPSVEGLLQETQIPGLRVLTAGPLPPNPAELLGSSRMKDLIAALNAHADMVILDTPPVAADPQPDHVWPDDPPGLAGFRSLGITIISFPDDFAIPDEHYCRNTRHSN